MRRTAFFLVASVWLLLGAVGASVAETPAAPPGEEVGVAVLDFAYSDTSGESRNSAAEHRARLDGLASGLRRDLSAGGRYRIVTPVCRPQSCEVGSTPLDDLMSAAKEAGAKLLVMGAVHKESTLIQWAKVMAVNVDDQRVIFDKLISFRGDSAEAWVRAEAFIAREFSSAGSPRAADRRTP